MALMGLSLLLNMRLTFFFFSFSFLPCTPKKRAIVAFRKKGRVGRWRQVGGGVGVGKQKQADGFNDSQLHGFDGPDFAVGHDANPFYLALPKERFSQ